MRQIKNLTNGIETSKALSALLSTKQWHLPNKWSRLLLKVCKRRVCVLRVASVLQKPQSKTSKTKNAFKYNPSLQKICVMIESDSYLIVDRTGYEKGTFIKDIKKWLTL